MSDAEDPERVDAGETSAQLRNPSRIDALAWRKLASGPPVFDGKQLTAAHTRVGGGNRALAAKAGIAPRTLHLMDRQSKRMETGAEKVFSAVIGSAPACDRGPACRRGPGLGRGLGRGLRRGQGLGQGLRWALAAELSGCPGPLHVEELADCLRLPPEQKYRP